MAMTREDWLRIFSAKLEHGGNFKVELRDQKKKTPYSGEVIECNTETGAIKFKTSRKIIEFNVTQVVQVSLPG